MSASPLHTRLFIMSDRDEQGSGTDAGEASTKRPRSRSGRKSAAKRSATRRAPKRAVVVDAVPFDPDTPKDTEAFEAMSKSEHDTTIPFGRYLRHDGTWQNAHGQEIDPVSGEQIEQELDDDERVQRRAELADEALARAEAGDED